MALHRLDNSGWGFQSNCFVCEPTNQTGLRIPFFYDDEARAVVADFVLGTAFSGTPNYVHGGVTLAVLDEAMAWCIIAQLEVFALTRSVEAKFLRPVGIGESCRVEARLTDEARGPVRKTTVVKAEAAVSNAVGEPCAKAKAEFAVMSQLEPFWST